MYRLATIALGATLLSTVSVQASTECFVRMADWQPRGEVVKLAAQNGWDVQRIKIDDGCYEIYATDADGRTFEVKVQPDTLEIVKIDYEEDDHDDGERHDGQGHDGDGRDGQGHDDD